MRLASISGAIALLFGVMVNGLAADASLPPGGRPGVRLHVDSQIKAKPYSLVRIRAEGVDAKAGIVWRVNPARDVSRATTPRGLLEFVAPPGQYVVDILVIKVGTGGEIEIDEQSVTVEIESCCDKVPPAPLPKPGDPKPKNKADPVAALGRIQFGNAGCTATVIGPRRADGRWDVLTAAHCVTGVGEGAKGSMRLKDGRTIAVRVSNIHEQPDIAWLVTDDATLTDLAFAELAKANPIVGTKIWHRGYGIDRPDNREDGAITANENTDGQLEMALSVSSGDSGGGIFRDDTGELISVVCCTTAKGQLARVWGGSALVAAKLRPDGATGENEEWWKPVEIPTRQMDAAEFRWAPVEMPEKRGPVVIDLRAGR